MVKEYIRCEDEPIIMKSIIEDTRAVSPIVATLLLIVVVASASSFIAVMVSDFGRDTAEVDICLLYTSPSPRDAHESRMPSSA